MASVGAAFSVDTVGDKMTLSFWNQSDHVLGCFSSEGAYLQQQQVGDQPHSFGSLLSYTSSEPRQMGMHKKGDREYQLSATSVLLGTPEGTQVNSLMQSIHWGCA